MCCRERFWGWLKENGAFLSPSIELDDYEGMGTGLRATESIRKGTVLFRIPRSLLLSRHSAKSSSIIRRTVADRGWNQAIWAVILERREGESFWNPYFNVLPDELHTPMSWSEGDKEFLNGSHIYHSVVCEGPSFYQQFLRDSRKMNCLPPTEQEFHYAGNLLSSYSFLENPKRPGDVALVPLADLLNHSSTQNNARLSPAGGSLEMIAVGDIAKDSQIYNTFGQLSNSDLLLKYGFIEEDNPNAYVKFDIPTIAEYMEMVIGSTALLDKTYDRLAPEYHLTRSSDSGLQRDLTRYLKLSFQGLLEWRLAQYPTILPTTANQRMASAVCKEETEIIRYHLNTVQ